MVRISENMWYICDHTGRHSKQYAIGMTTNAVNCCLTGQPGPPRLIQVRQSHQKSTSDNCFTVRCATTELNG